MDLIILVMLPDISIDFKIINWVNALVPAFINSNQDCINQLGRVDVPMPACDQVLASVARLLVWASRSR